MSWFENPATDFLFGASDWKRGISDLSHGKILPGLGSVALGAVSAGLTIADVISLGTLTPVTAPASAGVRLASMGARGIAKDVAAKSAAREAANATRQAARTTVREAASNPRSVGFGGPRNFELGTATLERPRSMTAPSWVGAETATESRAALREAGRSPARVVDFEAPVRVPGPVVTPPVRTVATPPVRTVPLPFSVIPRTIIQGLPNVDTRTQADIDAMTAPSLSKPSLVEDLSPTLETKPQLEPSNKWRPATSVETKPRPRRSRNQGQTPVTADTSHIQTAW